MVGLGFARVWFRPDWFDWPCMHMYRGAGDVMHHETFGVALSPFGIFLFNCLPIAVLGFNWSILN